MKLYAYAEYMIGRKSKFEYLPGSTPRGYPEESPKEKKFIEGIADTLKVHRGYRSDILDICQVLPPMNFSVPLSSWKDRKVRIRGV